MSLNSAIINSDKLSSNFKNLCAVTQDGTFYVAAGYDKNVELLNEIERLKGKKTLPAQKKRVNCDISEIAKLYEGEQKTATSQDETKKRLYALLDKAANALASDFIIQSDGVTANIFAIIRDEKTLISVPWHHDDAWRAIEMLFFAKEAGTRTSGINEAEKQGFSVTSTPNFKLPAAIQKLRVQRGPHAPHGQHLIARLFYSSKNEVDYSLEELGFDNDVIEVLSRNIHSIRGGIIIGGFTGDGKSTTLATCLALQQIAFEYKLNTMSVEDPPELIIPGVIQTAVATSDDEKERAENYRKALMHFVRVHPATGMVSEIRDGSAAPLVLDMIATGHQVWTTIHVKSVNEILFRLIDMGVSPANVAKPGNIGLLLKQTLVSILCPDCKISAEKHTDQLPDWLKSDLQTLSHIKLRNPNGCEKCRRGKQKSVSNSVWTGYLKQSAVAEYIVPDTGYLSFVRDRDPIGAQDYWINQMKGISINEKISDLIHAGEVDPRDALRKGVDIHPNKNNGLVVIENQKSGGVE